MSSIIILPGYLKSELCFIFYPSLHAYHSDVFKLRPCCCCVSDCLELQRSSKQLEVAGSCTYFWIWTGTTGHFQLQKAIFFLQRNFLRNSRSFSKISLDRFKQINSYLPEVFEFFLRNFVDFSKFSNLWEWRHIFANRNAKPALKLAQRMVWGSKKQSLSCAKSENVKGDEPSTPFTKQVDELVEDPLWCDFRNAQQNEKLLCVRKEILQTWIILQKSGWGYQMHTSEQRWQYYSRMLSL